VTAHVGRIVPSAVVDCRPVQKLGAKITTVFVVVEEIRNGHFACHDRDAIDVASFRELVVVALERLLLAFPAEGLPEVETSDVGGRGIGWACRNSSVRRRGRPRARVAVSRTASSTAPRSELPNESRFPAEGAAGRIRSHNATAGHVGECAFEVAAPVDRAELFDDRFVVSPVTYSRGSPSPQPSVPSSSRQHTTIEAVSVRSCDSCMTLFRGGTRAWCATIP